MSKTPASLLERLRQPDDNAAWASFVDLYTPLLYFWACRMGLQAQDAADLVQDVFATLLQKLPEFRYDADRSFRAWLRTLTLNRWRDLCRRKSAALRDGNAATLDDLVVPDGANAVWEAEYRQHVVGRALEIMQSEFQPSTWQACLAVIVDGKAAAVVAAELNMSVDAVYAARSRVLRRLRQELAGLLD